MAEPPKNQSSPTHSPHPESPKSDAGKSPHKRKPTSSATTPPPFKRPLTGDTATSNPEQEEDDTATSKLKKDDSEVQLPDSMVLKDLVEYHRNNGVYPFVDPDHMQDFCFMFIRLGCGNLDGWNAKFEHLKNKFKNHTDDTVDSLERDEFELWKKIFGNEGN